MEDKPITRNKPAILYDEVTGKKQWNPPTIKELEIGKNTDAGGGFLNDGPGFS